MNVLNSPLAKFKTQELKEMNNFHSPNSKILLSQNFILAKFYSLKVFCVLDFISSMACKNFCLHFCFCCFVVIAAIVLNFF